ncbi:MAG: hypothetical protein NZ455_04020 [Bacteroidia bacterium]|nr:hypothetical protein [Bacteroidia bacterium]
MRNAPTLASARDTPKNKKTLCIHKTSFVKIEIHQICIKAFA